jgi:hypothetical protein
MPYTLSITVSISFMRAYYKKYTKFSSLTATRYNYITHNVFLATLICIIEHRAPSRCIHNPPLTCWFLRYILRFFFNRNIFGLSTAVIRLDEKGTVSYVVDTFIVVQQSHFIATMRYQASNTESPSPVPCGRQREE